MDRRRRRLERVEADLQLGDSAGKRYDPCQLFPEPNFSLSISYPRIVSWLLCMHGVWSTLTKAVGIKLSVIDMTIACAGRARCFQDDKRESRDDIMRHLAHAPLYSSGDEPS